VSHTRRKLNFHPNQKNPAHSGFLASVTIIDRKIQDSSHQLGDPLTA